MKREHFEEDISFLNEIILSDTVGQQIAEEVEKEIIEQKLVSLEDVERLIWQLRFKYLRPPKIHTIPPCPYFTWPSNQEREEFKKTIECFKRFHNVHLVGNTDHLYFKWKAGMFDEYKPFI